MKIINSIHIDKRIIVKMYIQYIQSILDKSENLITNLSDFLKC